MKEFDVKEIHQGVESAKTDLDTVTEDISHLQRSITDFHGMEDALKGKAGTAIRSFYNDVHQPFLTFLHQSMLEYKDRLEAMKQEVQSFEPHQHGFISESFLENELDPSFDKAKQKTSDLTDETNQILTSISDIMYLSPLDDSAFQHNIEKGKQKIDHVIQDLHELDSKHASKLQQTKDDISTLKSYLSEMSSRLRNGSISITEFDINSIKNLPDYQKVIEQNYEKGNIVINADNIHDLPLQTIAKANSDGLDGLDENFQVILNKAYEDLEQGNITRETYYSIFSTVNKTKGNLTEAELEEEVPESFWNYVNDNKDKIGENLSKDLLSTSVQQIGIATTKLGGLINVVTGVKGPSGPSSFVMVNPATSGASNSLIHYGSKITSAGKWLGRGFMAAGFGIGMYDDLANKDKSVGEAITHNTTALGIGVAGSAIGTAATAVLLGSNPAGWAVLGGVAVGTGLVTAFNFAYDNNFLGLQDGLDYVGQQLDKAGEAVADFASSTVDSVKESAKDVGEAISSGIDSINPMNWGWG